MARLIKIEEVWFKQLKRYLSYPDLNDIILGDDDLKELCLFPALHDYYTRWPIREYQQVDNVTGVRTIPFPDDTVFGLLDIRSVGKTSRNTSQTGSDFWQLARYNRQTYGQYARQRGRMSNSKINFGGLQYTFLLENELNNALSEQETFRHTIKMEQQEVEVFSSISTNLVILWAKYNLDFDSIRHGQKNQVIKLAAAYALHHIADTGMVMEDDTSEKRFNVEALRTRATDLETAVRESWASHPPMIALRKS